MKSNIPTKHTHWQQLHQKLMNHAYFFSMLLLLPFIPLFRSHNIEFFFLISMFYTLKKIYLQKKFQYPYFVVAFYSEFVDKPIDIKWAINSVGMIINNTNEIRRKKNFFVENSKSNGLHNIPLSITTIRQTEREGILCYLLHLIFSV